MVRHLRTLSRVEVTGVIEMLVRVSVVVNVFIVVGVMMLVSVFVRVIMRHRGRLITGGGGVLRHGSE